MGTPFVVGHTVVVANTECIMCICSICSQTVFSFQNCMEWWRDKIYIRPDSNLHKAAVRAHKIESSVNSARLHMRRLLTDAATGYSLLTQHQKENYKPKIKKEINK